MARRIKIPLHITLLTLILTMLTSITGSLAWYNYHKSSNAAVDIAEELLDQVNETLLVELDSMFQPVLAIGERVSELPNLAEKPTLTSHPSTWFFVQALKSAPHIYSIYMGYADGDFYQIIQLTEDIDYERLQLGAPEGTRFILRRIITRKDGGKAEIWRYLDESNRTLGSRTVQNVTYDPRKRPWYQTASAEEGLVKTSPYVFTSNRSLGMTVARRFDGNIPGVFGVDLTLRAVSNFLATQEVGNSGKAFLFDFNGNLVAHPDPDVAIKVEQVGPETRAVPTRLYDLNDPVIDALYGRFIDGQGATGNFRFDVDDQHYLGRITRISDSIMNDGFVAVFAPKDDFTATMNQVLNDSKGFTIVLLIIMLPLAFLMAQSMARPLKKIAAEAEEIREFRLDDSDEVYSFISEINLLAGSFATMKGALKTFGQYVPKSLVKRIVESGETPKLGGKRRPLSLLFTDIENFTTLSESMEPEELMLQVSEYFQVTGSALIQNGATIDKFIGDAIMAFWNAPRNDPDHAWNACLSALVAADITNNLNKEWTEEGKNIFYTRFGLHTGECIVGNVGSNDRMDYTAMGDAVNLASRLEGLNKYFGTQILASESIREAAGDDFLFCPVGRVIPKGAISPVTVFTIFGTAPDKHLPLPARDRAIRFCAAWDKAYHLFQNREFDKAARAFHALAEEFPFTDLPGKYLERTHAYIEHPPSADWQGVETFTTK